MSSFHTLHQQYGQEIKCNSHLSNDGGFSREPVVPQRAGHPGRKDRGSAVLACDQLSQVVEGVESLQRVSPDPLLVGFCCLQHLQSSGWLALCAVRCRHM